jgi:hypothetical protein
LEKCGGAIGITTGNPKVRDLWAHRDITNALARAT